MDDRFRLVVFPARVPCNHVDGACDEEPCPGTRRVEKMVHELSDAELRDELRAAEPEFVRLVLLAEVGMRALEAEAG